MNILNILYYYIFFMDRCTFMMDRCTFIMDRCTFMDLSKQKQPFTANIKLGRAANIKLGRARTLFNITLIVFV